MATAGVAASPSRPGGATSSALSRTSTLPASSRRSPTYWKSRVRINSGCVPTGRPRGQFKRWVPRSLRRGRRTSRRAAGHRQRPGGQDRHDSSDGHASAPPGVDSENAGEPRADAQDSGPRPKKRAEKQIYDTLGITTLEALETAAKAGKLRELPGIKSTIEHKILQGLADLRGHQWAMAARRRRRVRPLARRASESQFGGRATGGRRQLSAPKRHRRRYRYPGRLIASGRRGEAVHVVSTGEASAGGRTDAQCRGTGLRAAGRPARHSRSVIWIRAVLLHRLQAAQHPHPPRWDWSAA